MGIDTGSNNRHGASLVYHHSAHHGPAKKTAEEPLYACCFARSQTMHHRYHSGDWYLHDSTAQRRKFQHIVNQPDCPYNDCCSWSRILWFKKSPKKGYFTHWTDWNIGFSWFTCVWILRHN